MKKDHQKTGEYRKDKSMQVGQNNETSALYGLAILSATLLIILIAGSVNMVVYDKGFYYSEYNKTGIYLQVSQSYANASSVVSNATESIMSYFHHNGELSSYFDSAEKSHLSDVRNVLGTISYLYYVALLIVVFMFIYLYVKLRTDKILFIDTLSRAMFYSGIGCIAFFILLFVSSVLSFSTTFTIFHEIFFPQGNWVFSSGLMITMFPSQFFFDAFLKIFLYAIFQAAVFVLIGWFFSKQLANFKKIRGMHR